MAWLPASTELRTLRKISNSNIFTTQKLDANQHLRRRQKVYCGVTTESNTPATPLIKKVFLHSASADRILLPDGRYMAYRVPGIRGLKTSLLEEFGICLLTYDIPGFGESDPHPSRNVESSVLDMLFLASSVGVNGKFWEVFRIKKEHPDDDSEMALNVVLLLY
ncbi:hypothetical protein Patl1_10280 [Pistacia atlantica]|uniref:Uncharacterized protein n=1 Tax=Pistacia atlantica TaxID=434234 RepID=A0ACC1A6H1_9ROSI|nr:hypothetical protein Patl1_10280 [Pistacia atlantica]